MPDWSDGLAEKLGAGDRNQVVACADLVGRTGARQFQIGYLNDEPPHGWYAHAMYRGARIGVSDQAGPAQAAMALAEKLLTGAKCRCGRLVGLQEDGAIALGKSTLADGSDWTAEQAAKAGTCRWRLVRDRWEPSCPVPPNRRIGPL